jgi:hypothetical protein
MVVYITIFKFHYPSKLTSTGVGFETISNTGDLFWASCTSSCSFSFDASAFILNVTFIFS